MTASSAPLVERERRSLADLLGTLGPDAPTCCAGWTTAHLAAHLVTRDRRPDALLGYGVEGAGLGGPVVAWTHRAEDRLRTSTPYAELVSKVRSGPPGWLPMGWPGVAGLLNVSEFVIHHEDVRRAQAGWAPRPLSREDQDTVWSSFGLYTRRAAGRRGVVLRRTDVEGVERRLGAACRTVAGEPLELLLWSAGRRDVARVTVS